MLSHSDFIEDWSTFLRRVSIFSDLEEEALTKVANKLKPLFLPKGGILYQEGDEGNALYVIQSGRVRIIRQDEHGKERLLSYLGRGDTFGETALLTGAPRSVTIKSDANTNLLVLYKSDFEQFLKDNPMAALYLSKLLSRRLHAASHPTPIPPPTPELVGFFCDLRKEDYIVFTLNLGLSLAEQTRRKVLLLETSPYGKEMIQAIGLTPPPISPKLMATLHENPKLLQQFTVLHPSGLEILYFPQEIFTDDIFLLLPVILETLRQYYDFVLINMDGMKNESSPHPTRKEEISRLLLTRCDVLYSVSTDEPTNVKFIYSLPQEKQEELQRIVLGEKSGSHFFPTHFHVPWSTGTTAPYLRGEHPFLIRPEQETSQKAINRIARAIGKLLVGLAMGSGAAYGYTLIGILRVLEREKIPIDFISGTSMGALLASFYAAGKSVDEIEKLAYSINKVWLRRTFLSDLNLPTFHGGLFVGDSISKFLRSVLDKKEFNEMVVPFACAATDVMTGDGVILRDGKVWQAVRASLSLPLIFCPYRMGTKFLVDGGLTNPVPTSLIASMGADILISINITTKASEKRVSLRRLGMFPSTSPGIFSIFFKMLYTMEYQVAVSKADLAHVTIRPDLKNFSWLDFHKAKQIIPMGETAAEESLTQIKSRLPFFADYCKVNLRLPR